MQQVRIVAVPVSAILALTCAAILFGLGLYTGLKPSIFPANTGANGVASAAIGAEAPDFSLPTPDGAQVRLSSAMGRPVVLLFWADWCSVCPEELADLLELVNRVGGQAAEIWAVSIMQEADSLDTWVKRHPAGVRFLADTEAAVSRLYGVVATPTYIFIDRSGRIAARIVGAKRHAAVEGRLRAILTED